MLCVVNNECSDGVCDGRKIFKINILCAQCEANQRPRALLAAKLITN